MARVLSVMLDASYIHPDSHHPEKYSNVTLFIVVFGYITYFIGEISVSQDTHESLRRHNIS